MHLNVVRFAPHQIRHNVATFTTLRGPGDCHGAQADDRSRILVFLARRA
jgi:hypothetical protein